MGCEDGHNLIFIIGLPRSGTTLLQTMLGQHQDIFTYSESWILLPLLFLLKKGGLIAPAYGANECKVGLEDQLEKSLHQRETYLKAVQKMVCHLYESCLKASGKKFFLDKSPPYYLITEDIAQIFPQAKIIILIRNPLAVLSSTARTWFEGKCHLILTNPVHMHSIFLGHELIASALKSLDGHCLTIKYEELVTSPEIELQKVCEYVGIRFDKRMLSYTAKRESIGRLGDKTGIYKYSKPVSFPSKNWSLLFKDYTNYRFAHSYIEYLGSHLFTSLGYDYEKTKSIISNKWNRKSPITRFYSKAVHLRDAIITSISRSLSSQKLAFKIEWSTTWRKYYPKFPPLVPDFSKLEKSWASPDIKILNPNIPITLYWRKIRECDQIEN